MIAKNGIFHIELTKPLLEPQVSVGPVVSTESSNTIGLFSPHSLFLQQVPHRERVASSAWIKWGASQTTRFSRTLFIDRNSSHCFVGYFACYYHLGCHTSLVIQRS